MNPNKFHQSQRLITGQCIHTCMPMHREVSVQAKPSVPWCLPPPVTSIPGKPPLRYCRPPGRAGRAQAGLCRLWAAAGIAEGRRHGEHPPPGSLAVLILDNCMLWHRAMDEVTPWPGTEQLRDLLAPKDRGELSALPRFYFI